MPTLTVSGASDDLIEVAGIEGENEFCDASGHWQGLIEAPNGDTAVVYVDLRPGATWTVALGQYDEDAPLPDWPQSFRVNPENCRYSVEATFEVPYGTIIREYKP